MIPDSVFDHAVAATRKVFKCRSIIVIAFDADAAERLNAPVIGFDGLRKTDVAGVLEVVLRALREQQRQV